MGDAAEAAREEPASGTFRRAKKATAPKPGAELGRFRRVYPRMWGDADFQDLSAAPPNAQTLWVRLLTGLETTIIPGVIPCWEGGLANALHWPLEGDGGERKGFRECFAEISAKAMAEADWDAGLVFVPKGIGNNPPENPNVILGWGAQWLEVPECALKLRAWEQLRAWVKERRPAWLWAFDRACPKPKLRARDLRKGFPEGTANQDQDSGLRTQEQDQERDQRPPTPAEPSESLPADAEPASRPEGSGAELEGSPEEHPLAELAHELLAGELAEPTELPSEEAAAVGTTVPPAGEPARPAATSGPDAPSFQLTGLAPRPAPKAPPAPAKARPHSGEHQSDIDYAEAYARGVAKARDLKTRSALRDYPNRQAMRRIVQELAKDDHEAPLRGEALRAWLEEQGMRYAKARPREQFECGWSHVKFFQWLNTGCTSDKDAAPKYDPACPIQGSWGPNKSWKIGIDYTPEELAAADEARRQAGISR